MAEITYPGGVAILIEDERATLDTDASTYTEADTLPTVAPDNTSALQIQVTGTAPSTVLEVRAQQGGIVGRGATYVWREATSGDWTGHEEPTVIQAYQSLIDSSDVTINYVRHPHAVSIDNSGQQVAIAYAVSRTASPGYVVYVGTISRDGQFAAVEVYSQTSAPGIDFQPCLVKQGTRLLCYFWVYDSGDDSAQIRMHYSDDDGASWSMGSEGVLPSPIAAATTDWTLGRIRAASLDGAVMMLIHQQDQSGTFTVHSDQIHQYASVDFGSRFVFVDSSDEDDTTAGLAGGIAPDVAATADGQLVAAWINSDATAADINIYATTVGAAQDSIFDQIPVQVSDDQHATVTVGPPTVLADADLTLTVDVTGDIVLLARLPSGSTFSACVARRSVDGGESWTEIGQGSYGAGSTWWRVNHAATHPRDFAAAWQAGRLVVACVHDADTGGRDDSLCLLSLGGPSSVTMPRYHGNTDSPDSQVSWDWTWVPWDQPDTLGATKSGSGTATLYLTHDEIVTTALQALTYQWARSLGDINDGAIVRRVLQVQSGGSLTSDFVGVDVVIDDGSTASYGVTVRASTTGLRLMDNVAGTQVGSDATFSAGSKIEVRIAIAGSSATAWWRIWTWDSSNAWAELGSTSSLTAGGAGAGQAVITWGHLSASGATSLWFEAGDQWDTYVGSQQAAGITNPEDLHGRGYSAQGSTAGTEGAVILATGVAIRGDQHTISPGAQRGIARLHSGASTAPFRTSDTTAITLLYPITTHGDAPMGTDVLGIAAKASNAVHVTVYGVPASGPDVTLADVDLSEGMKGLKWTRSGDAIRVQTSSASTVEPFFKSGELRGCQVALDDGVGGWDTRVIRRNRGGAWDHDGGRREVLYLEGVDGTEAASGTDAWIIPAQWAILIDMHGREYESIKVVIAAPSGSIPGPAESYFEIGRMTKPCFAVLPHYQPAWGTRVLYEPRLERLEARDGSRVTTKLGAMSRRVRIGWVDAISEYNVAGNWHEVSDDASAEAMGTPGYELHAWVDIVQSMDDGAGLLTYIDGVTAFTGGTSYQLFNRRDDVLLADLEDDGVALDEVVDELNRGDALNLTEIR